MNDSRNPNVGKIGSNVARLLSISPLSRIHKGRALATEKLSELFLEVENYLTQGFASDAEERCLEVLENYRHSLDAQAQLSNYISHAFEMQGRFAEALEILKPFENKEIEKTLQVENYATLLLRQGIAYNYSNNSSKAISALTLAQRIAEERDLIHLLVKVHIAFAQVYRNLNEFSVSRNYVDKAIRYARRVGDWRGLTEAYQVLASGYHQEGKSLEAIENLQKSIQMIGNRPAAFLLGKLYSDISVVYWAVNNSQEGIANAQKAVGILEKTGNKYQTAIAFNNLGTNLILSGDWKKAKDFLDRAINLAHEIDHKNLASFICSMGELNLLVGNYEEAEKQFNRALKLSEQKENEWYSVQILYHLARCLLAQNKTSSALETAQKTIKRCERINETHYKHLIQVVLAESYFRQKKISEAEEILFELEESEAEELLLQGFVSGLRGEIALRNKDEELAIHHFSRSLTNFDKAGNLYQIAFANYKLGAVLAKSQPDKADKHLTSAIETFRKIEDETKLKLAKDLLSSLKTAEISVRYEHSNNSHLLMLRLIESISSRENLFRELIDILADQGKEKRLIVADVKRADLFIPCAFTGFADFEVKELLGHLAKASATNDLDEFAKENKLSVFHLRAPNTSPAILVVSSVGDAVLADGSSIQPLLRVVEIGMEVCAYRENLKESPVLDDSNPLSTRNLMPNFVYSSKPMLDLVNEIQRIRTSDVTTLITGESGSGKELVARAIHVVSKRKDKVFVPFNCTAIPRDLVEGHLFGYKKGAFTGADSDYEGLIRSADGGTLFLDEIGDLGLDVQPKILRFLQEGEVQTLGAKSPKKVDVRIIAATNMNLEEKVRQGLFREDLYYRLNVIRLYVPPLRERRSEIPELVKYFLDTYSEKFGRKNLSVSPEAMSLLIAYDWQGNVRQLCNEVQRMVARAESGERIGLGHLSKEIKPVEEAESKVEQENVQIIGLTEGAFNVQTQGKTLDEIVSALEIQLITDSLERHKNNISRVAKELGLTRRGLYLKLNRYGLREGES